MAVLVVLVILLAFRRRLTRRWRIALHGWRRALLVLLLVLHGRMVFLHLALRCAVLLLVLRGRVVFLHLAFGRGRRLAVVGRGIATGIAVVFLVLHGRIDRNTALDVTAWRNRARRL